MAHDDGSDQGENPRGHHAPEHANTKHERVMDSVKGDEPKAARGNKLKQWWAWAMSCKKVSIPVAVLVLLALLAALPFTRYALAGMVLKQNFAVTVTDSQTSKPVTSATVTLDGKKATTDSKGHAILHVKVGGGTLEVSKTYYKTADSSVTVPLGKQKQPAQVSLVATGRQVPVTVLNTITGQPLANAVITAGKSQAKTDAKGQAIIVIAASATKLDAKIMAAGYNDTTVVGKVATTADPANTFKITPTGKVYFLSNLSGKIDVVKTNLDGTNRQTVLPGTGKEVPSNTILLASTDWKYLALLSRRAGGDFDKLYLINTSNDQLTTMDEGNATFSVAGWDGHSFIYNVYRDGYQFWQPHAGALKAYDAESGKITVLDQTNAGGGNNNYWDESLGSTYIIDGAVVYAKDVYASNYLIAASSTRQATLNSIQPDGSNKKVLKTYSADPAPTFVFYVDIDSVVYQPDALYFYGYSSEGSGVDGAIYSYDGSQVKAQPSLKNIYPSDGSTYPLYLDSPSGKETFWTEQRDGKNSLLVGDDEGQDGKQVASLSDFKPYGWFTDNYLFVSKNNNELYIMPSAGGTALKVSDYFRSDQIIRGYGGGY